MRNCRVQSFIYCNERFAEAIGLDSPHQIIKKNDYDFFDAQSIKKYHLGDICAIRGEPYINVLEHQKRLDQTFQNLVTKTPLKNKNDKINGVVISFLTSQNFSRHLNEDIIKFNDQTGKYEFYIDKEKITFSKKEFAVFKLVLIGNTSRQIALKINISIRTVDDYILSLKLKLQCSNKSCIAETAHRLGIINQHLFL